MGSHNHFDVYKLMRYLIAIVFLCGSAFGACVAASPAGGGAGTDWGSPKTMPSALVAGTTYYLATGTYSFYHWTGSGTPTNPIKIIKATDADHGQGCSPALTGWTAGMDSGPATFNVGFGSSGIWIESNYVTFDGARRNADWISGYGIVVNMAATNTNCPGFGADKAISVTNFSGSSIDHVTIQNVEISGPGYALNPDLCAVDGIYGFNGPPTNLTIQNNYIHDVTGQMTIQASGTGLTGGYGMIVKNNVIARDYGHAGGTQHTEAISIPIGTNWLIQGNKFIDIVSTGVIVTTNNAVCCTADNFKILDNTFWWTPGNPNAVDSGVDNAIVSCGALKVCTNWVFSNNTIAGCNWSGSTWTSHCAGLELQTAGSTATMQNNLWYDSINPNLPGSGTFTHDHNTCVSGATANCTGFVSESTSGSGSINPFNGYSTGDLTLIQDMGSAAGSGSQWSQGVSLSSLLTTDLVGTTFGADGTWERGAYEFAASSVPGASLSPASLSYSNTLVGSTSASQAAILTSNGTGPLTVSSVTASGDFTVTSTSPSPCGTLAVGATCTINVAFSPTTVGARSGTLTVVDNASASPQTVSLSGTGTAQATLKGTLTLKGTAAVQ